MGNKRKKFDARINLLVDNKLKKKLEILANKFDLDVSDIARRALNEFVAREDKDINRRE